MRIQSLCVYCGSAAHASHRAAAADLGRLMAGRGIRLVTGGGDIGLMGVVANAALAAGGHVTGIIPRFLVAREVHHKALSETLLVDSMHERKQRMFDLADGFVVLPGGLGTLDETIEVMTWRQLGLHDKPILLLDLDGYWKPFLDLVAHVITAGYARRAAAGLVAAVPTPDALFAALDALPEPATRGSGDRL